MGNTADQQEAHPVFRFAIQIEGMEGAVFNECTLPSFKMKMTQMVEGGFQNRVRWLPSGIEPGNIVLKGGTVKDSAMLKWYQDAITGKYSEAARHVSVVFYDSKHTEVFRLYFLKVVPVKWTGPNLKASDNSIAIETLELAYEELG
jgi:phage tail-like protein